ncbi:ADP-ribosylation factor-like protein 13A [Megalops cyprinoides]|uniref:ADP-ribosylation factor-like protein 13A n=1 Tax=Megalops cyprinoides TaxID=118141 RepID=UPI001863F5AA|nr:ADP-ribosylation factor-like protein 13A [Megalops cyprinoides]
MDIEILLCDLPKRWWPLCSPQDNMFNLMSNCCSWVSKYQQPVRKATVLVVGLDNAGKTSTVKGILKVFPGESNPAQGCIQTDLRVDNFLVTLLDMAGVTEFRGAWKDHYGEAHGIIFVVDSSDRPRIREVKELLVDLLKQPRVAGKPLLVLANKQDKMGALLGSELIEALQLEKLVNQSHSLCHIEPCSALLDVRRWSDRKALRGLRWLLRAISLDYPELCARVARDHKRPPGPEEKDRRVKNEKGRGKPKEDRIRSSKTDLRQAQRPQKDKEPQPGGKLEPIRNILKKDGTMKRKLKKKKQVKIKDGVKSSTRRREEEEEEEGVEAEQELSGQKEEKASTALLPRNRGKLTRKARVKEETMELRESPDNEESKPKTGKGEKKKKKKPVKVKRKNKINTEEMPAAYSQPVDLSATFDLYRQAILALKARQEQGH